MHLCVKVTWSGHPVKNALGDSTGAVETDNGGGGDMQGARTPKAPQAPLIDDLVMQPPPPRWIVETTFVLFRAAHRNSSSLTWVLLITFSGYEVQSL